MLINSPNISGSLTVTGNIVATGSLTVAGTITGTVAGTTATASYVEYNNVANKPTLVSGSSQITYSGLSGIPSGIVSGSAQITGFGIFATTGSNQFNGNQAITGSLTTTGTIVAQTLNVQQVTSSIVYSSGSNIFGNSVANTQQFTGSLQVTGSTHHLLGNVGVGTTSPELRLDVKDVATGGSIGMFIENAAASTLNNSADIYFGTWGGASIGGITNARISAVNVDAGNAATDLRFHTYNGSSSAERMRITSDGNVGIGTTSPASTRLAVRSSTGGTDAGESVISATLGDNSTISNALLTIRNAGNRGNIGNANGSSLFRAEFNNATAMIINKDGNIGIGTASPSRTLHILGASGIGTVLKLEGASGTTTYLQLAYNGATDGQSGYIGYDSSANMPFFTSNTERMRINSSGNVLIGTTSDAGSRLQVEGGNFRFNWANSSTAYYLWLNKNSTQDGGILLTKDNTLDWQIANTGSTGNLVFYSYGSTSNALTLARATGAATFIGNVTAGNVLFWNNGVGALSWDTGLVTMETNTSTAIVFKTNGNERMRITAGGNIGINSTSPQSRFEVVDGTGSVFRAINNGTNVMEIGNYKANGSGYQQLDIGASIITLITGTAGGGSGTERMRITSDGNVGIGTTSPSVQFNVSHANHGIGIAYIGASSLPAIAGLFTDVSSGQQGYGSLLVKSRSDFANYSINFFTAATANTPVERLRITSTGTVQPGANGTQDLGTASLRWATVFTSDLSLSNGIGDYTIVEGEHDLFLYNNKNNKVYKFLVEEVDPSTATPKKS